MDNRWWQNGVLITIILVLNYLLMSHVYNSLISHPTAKIVPKERENMLLTTGRVLSFHLLLLFFFQETVHQWHGTSPHLFHLLFSLIFSASFSSTLVIYSIAEKINIWTSCNHNHILNKSNIIYLCSEI